MSIHRIKVFFWFIVRPTLYKQFVREIISFVSRKGKPSVVTSEESLHWCKQNALSEETALKKINPDWKFFDFNIEFPTFVKNGFNIIESFDFNWGGQGNLSLNYSLARNLNAVSIIETGVAYGWSSLSLLAYLENIKGGTLTSIDMPFWGTKHENKIGCVVPNELKDKWNLIRLPDRDAIPKILKSNIHFDLCHYDSDKTYCGKMWALPKLWERVSHGGVLICDDINDNLAFKHFCENEGIKPTIVKTFDSQVEKYVGIVLKANSTHTE